MIQNACLVSQSTKISADMLRDAAAAYNTHMSRDFRPLWGRSTNVTTAPSLKAVPRGYWPVVFMDKMDQPGALGYHTAQHNQPISFCLATPEWDITGCHELDEMTVDPFGNRLSLVRSMPYGTDQVQFLIETDDPIEAQSYAIDGIRCSNFLTPEYYDESATDGQKYDFLGTLKAPRTLIEGGYVSYVFEDGSWGQTTNFDGNGPSSRTLEARPAKHQPLRNFIDQQTQAYKEALGVI